MSGLTVAISGGCFVICLGLFAVASAIDKVAAALTRKDTPR